MNDELAEKITECTSAFLFLIYMFVMECSCYGDSC